MRLSSVQRRGHVRAQRQPGAAHSTPAWQPHPSMRRHPAAPAPAAHTGPGAMRSGMAGASASALVQAQQPGWEADGSMGPAFRATLDLLEWPRLCAHMADFASTTAGKQACRQMPVPEGQSESERLHLETRALLALELEFSNTLDFGGINTADATLAVMRADKGGMVAAHQLRALVTLLQGAEKLRRQIQTTARQRQLSQRGSVLWPLLQPAAALQLPSALERDIIAWVSEENEIHDSASEQVRTARAKLRGLRARLASALKSYPGEVSERSGRMCIAAPTGTKVAGGILLGSTPGGGMVYLEPPAVVGLNNDLLAARAEVAAAEEAVLWSLTARLMACLPEVQAALELVTWLDATAAKARFGVWLGGVQPEFVPWEEVFHVRGAAAARRAAQTANADEDAGLPRWAVCLRELRHPLLHADYLVRRQELEKAVREKGGNAGAAALGSDGKRRIRSSSLGTRRESLFRTMGSSSSDEEGDVCAAEALAQQLEALRPPRAIDITISGPTTVVVITGPNTGGKTAAMKALGLTVCLAKAGVPVTCAAPARLPAFSSVLADIGDEQSLSANLSTFSGHLKRIQGLRAEADGKALVLLDELGTGTDPTEGAALGAALLKRMVNGGIGNGALTVATTHHSVMTALKFQDARFENASVEFDEAALAPTYRLLWGVPGRSNALNIAERLGLDADVVAAARARLDGDLVATNAAIEKLETVRGHMEKEELAAWALQQQVQELKRKAEALQRTNTSRQAGLTEQRLRGLAELAVQARSVFQAAKQERKLRARGSVESATSQRLDSLLGPLDTTRASAAEALAQYRALGSGGGAAAPRAAGAAGAFADDPLVAAWREAVAKAQLVAASSPSGSMEASLEEEEDDLELQEEVETLNRLQQRMDELQRQRRASADDNGAPGDAVATKGILLDELNAADALGAAVGALEESLDEAQWAAQLAQMRAEEAARQQEVEAAAATARSQEQQRREEEDAALLAKVTAIEQALDAPSLPPPCMQASARLNASPAPAPAITNTTGSSSNGESPPTQAGIAVDPGADLEAAFIEVLEGAFEHDEEEEENMSGVRPDMQAQLQRLQAANDSMRQIQAEAERRLEEAQREGVRPPPSGRKAPKVDPAIKRMWAHLYNHKQ